MKRFSLNLPDGMARSLEREAALQGRSISNTVVWYLTSDVAMPQVEHPAEVVAVAVGPMEQPAVRRVTPAAKGRAARTATCVHRVPAGAFCKACDS